MTIKDTEISLSAQIATFATELEAVKATVAGIVVTEANSAQLADVNTKIAALEAELLPTPAPAA